MLHASGVLYLRFVYGFFLYGTRLSAWFYSRSLKFLCDFVSFYNFSVFVFSILLSLLFIFPFIVWYVILLFFPYSIYVLVFFCFTSLAFLFSSSALFSIYLPFTSTSVLTFLLLFWFILIYLFIPLFYYLDLSVYSILIYLFIPTFLLFPPYSVCPFPVCDCSLSFALISSCFSLPDHFCPFPPPVPVL